MTQGRRAHGAHGEAMAARWYEARGWVVLDRNWRCAEGEIDVIVERDDTVVFCEVKARRDARYGTGLEAVTPAKQRRLRRLAARWLAERPAGERRRVVRFDVAAIEGGVRIEVVEAAF